MNKTEKKIYNILKNIPWLKFLIRNMYQGIFDLLPRKKEMLPDDLQFKEDYFFGFHDCSPFSYGNDKILACHTEIPLRMPLKTEPLKVGYFEFNSGKLGNFVKTGESFAWNYHKGCRLQWISDKEMIYNSAIDDRLCSVIKNVENGKSRVIDFPIDTVFPDGKLATSFSYERLQKLMPGYGYSGYRDCSFLNENAPEETGLFVIDLNQNNMELLVSLADLTKALPENIRTGYKHYVTHSEFSKDGRYISFLHRWVSGDIRKRTSRLIIYNLAEKRYYALALDGMVSHYVWNNKNQIIAYCGKDGKDGHILFDICDEKKDVKFKRIFPEILNSDGHQCFLSDSLFVTDTYPDKYRMAKLYKGDIDKNKIFMIASLYSPKQYQTKNFLNHIACDLHPRSSYDGSYICFDSPRTGKRALYVMPAGGASG